MHAKAIDGPRVARITAARRAVRFKSRHHHRFAVCRRGLAPQL
jgi:hypothetical protein